MQQRLRDISMDVINAEIVKRIAIRGHGGTDLFGQALLDLANKQLRNKYKRVGGSEE